MNELSPIVSEFETEQQAALHDAWLRGKVAASLADSRPVIAHDAAMARLDIILATKGESSQSC